MSPGRRILYVDATAGAAGDMLLGALVDAGVPLGVVRAAARALPVDGWTLSARRREVQGIRARKVRVGVGADEDRAHRTWSDVAAILDAADLDPAVREDARTVFRRLFEAEAAVHGRPVDEVHLHEAGAVDALIDIVGTCAAVRHLEVARVVVSPLTTGSGRVRCRHGDYPVPAPATQRLLLGVPSTSGGCDGERLTPTGAALLTTLADAWGPPPAMIAEWIGYGAGDRDFPDRPNVVRVVVGREPDDGADLAPPADDDAVRVVECTLDDMPAQNLAWTLERLLEVGALDAWVTPVTMKKGRPGHVLTALVRPDGFDAVADVVLRETSTLGLRHRPERRIELDRRHDAVDTPFGPIRVKVAVLDGRDLKAWPEYDDCAAAARSSGVALADVQRAALRAHDRRTPTARGRRARRGPANETGGRR